MSSSSKKYIILILSIAAAALSGCKKDDQEKPEPPSLDDTCNSGDYCFIRDGEICVNSYYSWVSLNQLEEFQEAMGSVDGGTDVSFGIINGYMENASAVFETEGVLGVFSYFSSQANHQEVRFSELRNPARNSYYNSLFSQYSQDSQIEAFSQEGSAGYIFGVNNPNAKYLIDENGKNYNALISSSLIADCYYYGFQENTFDYVLTADTGYIQIDTLNYSNNEKRWDDMYGFLGIPVDFLTNTDEARYIGKMCDMLDPALNTNMSLFNALYNGREAIYNSDVSTVNSIIPETQLIIHRILAGSIIHYLKKATTLEIDFAERSKEMSHALGLVQALQYSNNNLSLSAAQTAEFNTILGDNFYNTTNQDLQSAIDWVVSNSTITNSEAQNI